MLTKTNTELAFLSRGFSEAVQARINGVPFLSQRMQEMLSDESPCNKARGDLQRIHERAGDIAYIIDDKEAFEQVFAAQKIEVDEMLAAFIEEYFGAVFAKSVISEDQRSHQASQGFQSHGAPILAKLFKPR